MALDEQLINRSGSQEEKADDSGSDAPDYGYKNEDQEGAEAADRAGQLRMAKKGNAAAPGGENPSDLRSAKMAAKREKDSKSKAGQLIEKALSPIKQALAKALQWSWLNLISSFGLTLFIIDAHVFLRQIFGDKLFCDLGEEWILKKSGAAGVKK